MAACACDERCEQQNRKNRKKPRFHSSVYNRAGRGTGCETAALEVGFPELRGGGKGAAP